MKRYGSRLKAGLMVTAMFAVLYFAVSAFAGAPHCRWQCMWTGVTGSANFYDAPPITICDLCEQTATASCGGMAFIDC
ncbi:MAG: hypothetical protein QNK37_11105 [Acidobacteriota bacterium]|nr:hypothetical protein [Acidobacteriota bacterium]